MQREVILCLDIGGTNCRIGLVDRAYEVYAQQIWSTEALAEHGFMEGLSEKLAQYRKIHKEHFLIRQRLWVFPPQWTAQGGSCFPHRISRAWTMWRLRIF